MPSLQRNKFTVRRMYTIPENLEIEAHGVDIEYLRAEIKKAKCRIKQIAAKSEIAQEVIFHNIVIDDVALLEEVPKKKWSTRKAIFSFIMRLLK